MLDSRYCYVLLFVLGLGALARPLEAKRALPVSFERVADVWIGLSTDERFLMRVDLGRSGNGSVGYAFEDEEPRVFKVSRWTYRGDKLGITLERTEESGKELPALIGVVHGTFMQLSMRMRSDSQNITLFLQHEKEILSTWCVLRQALDNGVADDCAGMVVEDSEGRTAALGQQASSNVFIGGDLPYLLFSARVVLERSGKGKVAMRDLDTTPCVFDVVRWSRLYEKVAIDLATSAEGNCVARPLRGRWKGGALTLTIADRALDWKETLFLRSEDVLERRWRSVRAAMNKSMRQLP